MKNIQATLKEAVQGRDDKGGRPTTILGIDIELFKHNIDLLKYSLDYAEAIIDTIREPLVVLNKKLQVITANRSFYQTFGFTPEETENHLLYELGGNLWNIPKLKKLLKNVLAKDTYFENFEIEYTTPQKRRRTLVLNARRFYRRINQTETVLLAIEDITEAKNFERQKDEFAALIMHELKTPVTTINGYLQLFQAHLSKRTDQKLMRYADQMEEQVHRLTSLVNGLLNSSRIRATGFEFNKTLFDFDELVEETIIELQKASQTHRIYRIGKVEKQILADKERIRQVLVNLIINAVKYSPNSDQVIVETSLARNNVIVAIKDFGIGISKKNQKKVFERFFRIAPTDKETFYGVGLGLDISSQIIRYHKGRIWIESNEGKGSIFYFSLSTKKP